MTCTAEIGGVAIVLRLLSGWEYRLLILVGVALLVLAAWFLPFEWIERLFGYVGLCLLVFAVAALELGVDWGGRRGASCPGARQQRRSSTRTSRSACSARR